MSLNWWRFGCGVFMLIVAQGALWVNEHGEAGFISTNIIACTGMLLVGFAIERVK